MHSVEPGENLVAFLLPALEVPRLFAEFGTSGFGDEVASFVVGELVQDGFDLGQLVQRRLSEHGHSAVEHGAARVGFHLHRTSAEVPAELCGEVPQVDAVIGTESHGEDGGQDLAERAQVGGSVPRRGHQQEVARAGGIPVHVRTHQLDEPGGLAGVDDDDRPSVSSLAMRLAGGQMAHQLLWGDAARGEGAGAEGMSEQCPLVPVALPVPGPVQDGVPGHPGLGPLPQPFLDRVRAPVDLLDFPVTGLGAERCEQFGDAGDFGLGVERGVIDVLADGDREELQRSFGVLADGGIHAAVFPGARNLSSGSAARTSWVTGALPPLSTRSRYSPGAGRVT
ncbi:hypothetical protein EES43_25990 [Streptomyces sp. ADI96-02]|nr:hypothetical protein EES43_25990 [Streptomyces sp. ADI96-02]